MNRIWHFRGKYDQHLSLYCSKTKIQDRAGILVLVRVLWVRISKIYWQFLQFLQIYILKQFKFLSHWNNMEKNGAFSLFETQCHWKRDICIHYDVSLYQRIILLVLEVMYWIDLNNTLKEWKYFVMATPEWNGLLLLNPGSQNYELWPKRSGNCWTIYNVSDSTAIVYTARKAVDCLCSHSTIVALSLLTNITHLLISPHHVTVILPGLNRAATGLGGIGATVPAAIDSTT